MPGYRLTLYIAGRTPSAERALANLQRICAKDLHGQYEVSVVDVTEDPQRAEQARVLATPTLVRELPPPIRRVIGDLSDHAAVLVGLNLAPVEGA